MSSPAQPRPSARVARVAELLDCDETKVRRLIDTGELQAHRLGTRGVRVYLDSVSDYQLGQQRSAKRSAKPEKKKARLVKRASVQAAETQLRKLGIID